MTVLWPNGTNKIPAISSPYGPRVMPGAYSNFHYGTDFIDFPYGCSVLEGVVTLAGPYTRQAGISVAVDSIDPVSKKTVTIVYMHASKVLVQKGDKVHAGQRILVPGSTGNATGVCVHTEIRYWSGGKYSTTDPVPLIKRWMIQPTSGPKVRVARAYTNTRDKPSTNGSIVGHINAGKGVTVVAYAHGQNVLNNQCWYKLSNGQWAWSGGFQNGAGGVTGIPFIEV